MRCFTRLPRLYKHLDASRLLSLGFDCFFTSEREKEIDQKGIRSSIVAFVNRLDFRMLSDYTLLDDLDGRMQEQSRPSGNNREASRCLNNRLKFNLIEHHQYTEYTMELFSVLPGYMVLTFDFSLYGLVKFELILCVHFYFFQRV